jgi:peptidylprolyl isomerase
MQLKSGRVKIELRPDLAPNHVARVKGSAGRFLRRRRLPSSSRVHGTDRRSDRYRQQRLKAQSQGGVLARSSSCGAPARWRSGSPDSANSQFFICFDDAPWLDGKYTVWGKVVEGMEHIDAIKKGDANDNGSVVDPDKVISMTLP